MTFHIMQFSSAACFFLLPRSKYLFQHSILKHPQSFGLHVGDHVLYRHKRTSGIIILHGLILML
jgi:hypothetical protein